MARVRPATAIHAVKGSGLAATLENHLGHLYVFGGVPGRRAQFGWDCSSCVNWCCSRNGLRVPGHGPGKYQGLTHGASTFGWHDWAPRHLHAVRRSDVQRDDICLWHTHIGIAVDHTHYASAYYHGAFDGTHWDTIIAPIHGGGPTGETASFWRYAGGAGGGGGGGNPPPGPRPGQAGIHDAWHRVQHMTGPWASWQFRHIKYTQKRARELIRK